MDEAVILLINSEPPLTVKLFLTIKPSADDAVAAFVANDAVPNIPDAVIFPLALIDEAVMLPINSEFPLTVKSFLIIKLFAEEAVSALLEEISLIISTDAEIAYDADVAYEAVKIFIVPGVPVIDPVTVKDPDIVMS